MGTARGSPAAAAGAGAAAAVVRVAALSTTTLARLVSAHCVTWPPWLPVEMMVVMVAGAGLLAPLPYSGFSCGGRAMSMWSHSTGLATGWMTRLLSAALQSAALATGTSTSL